MNSEEKEIPLGWATANIEIVSSELISGSGFPKAYQGDSSGEFPFAKVGDISKAFRAKQKCIDSANHFISEEVRKGIKARIFPKGTIVFPKIGEALKGNYRLVTSREMLFDNNVMGIVPNTKIISADFLFYFLNTQDFGKFSVATAVPSVRRGDVAAIQMLLPPLNEQHRIVAKIEELFSELDKGIENLKTAREQLKVYRQALLKHAFEGRLTAQWREERRTKSSVTPAKAGVHADEKLDSRLRGNDEPLEPAAALLARIQTEREQRYRQQLQQWQATGGNKPKAPKSLPPLTAEELAELPVLPEGWGWEKLGNIADLIGGVTKGKDLEGKEKISLPYLRVANVQDGYLDLTEIKNIEVEAQDKDKYRLEHGDVLYTEGGDKDKLGRGAVWRSQIENCIHQNHIFRARIFGGVISPEILSLYSQTKSAKKYFFRHAKQTTNLASINLTVLSNLPVAIFSQSEQKQILQEIEARLSEADQLDQTLAASLQQSEALRQSILKKAFSGQLVAQDANDEPAAALLARIRAEKDAQSATSRKTGKGQA